MRRILPWLLRLIGPVLLVVFLVTSDIEQLFTVLINADFGLILLSLLLMFPFMIAKTWRWQLILREMGHKLDFWTGFNLYAVGIYYGTVTPGQAGDLLKAWYLRERSVPLAPGLLSVVLDRLCDLLVMVVIATLGIVALGQLLPDRNLQALLVVAMGLGLITLAVFLIARGPRTWLLTGLLPRILPSRLSDMLRHWSEQFATLTLTPRLVGLLAVASLISATFTFYRLWLLFVSVGVVMPIWVVVGASALIAVLQVLPISIAGFGVREAVLIAAVAPYGYEPAEAIAVSALFLVLSLQHILIGFLISFWYPIDRAIAGDLTRETVPEGPTNTAA